MEIKRTTDISVETTRRFVIRRPETHEKIPCPECGELMLTAEAAAALFRVNCRLLYRIVEAGAAHFVETETGAILVCTPSLDRAIGNVDDVPSAEIVKAPADAAVENQTEEIEIHGESL